MITKALAKSHNWIARAGTAKIERDALRDEVPAEDEPGFYELGRSPSLLLAHWFGCATSLRCCFGRDHEPPRALTN